MLQQSMKSAFPAACRRWRDWFLNRSVSTLCLSPAHTTREQSNTHTCEEQDEASNEQPDRGAEMSLGVGRVIVDMVANDAEEREVGRLGRYVSHNEDAKPHVGG